MKCRQCGQELDKNSRKCPHCGYVNSLDNLLKKVQIPKELRHLSRNDLEKHLNRQRYLSKGRYLIIAVVVVFVVGSFSFSYFRKIKKTAPIPNFHDDLIESTSSNAIGNSVGNLVNGGLLVQYGNDLYASDCNGISKISMTLDKKEVLLNQQVSYLNADQDGLYFINNSDNNTICFYDLAANTLTKLNFQATQLTSVGKYLYYLESNNTRAIYQVNKETLESKKMTQSECVQFKIIGDWLYYTTDSALYQMPVLGGEIMKVSDQLYNHFIVDGQTIYYIDKTTGYIESVKKNGEEKKVVVDVACNCFFLTEHYIFYTKEDGGLFKQNRETGELYTITEDQANRLHVAGTWVYYLLSDGTGRFVSVDENSEMITPVDIISETE